jgi:hypothetical protein
MRLRAEVAVNSHRAKERTVQLEVDRCPPLVTPNYLALGYPTGRKAIFRFRFSG